MDNTKTGALIKELRKEKELTQLELAKALHVTDRAVSKWERGICAPDIGLLESLSAVLGVTVTELIAGERFEETPAAAVEENVQKAINYSDKELKEKTHGIRKKYHFVIAGVMASIMLICAVLWWNGVFNIIGRYESPDGSMTLTVYNRDITEPFNRERSAVTVKCRGSRSATSVYICKNFKKLIWSPDSRKYIISFDTDEGVRHSMVNFDRSSASNLNAYFDIAMGSSDMRHEIMLRHPDGSWIEPEYEILQWSEDEKSILVYFIAAFNGKTNEGYFWYNTESGTIEGIMKMRHEEITERESMKIYEEYKKLNIAGSLIGLEPGDEEGGYFCTPMGMKVIGWETGGIHYGTVPEYGDMIFAVNPMSCVDDYVYPVAENFVDFMRLILACESTTAIEQIVWWDKAQFEDFLGNEEYNVRTPERTAALRRIQSELALSPMENPFEYVKKLQKEFDGSRLRFAEEEEDSEAADFDVVEFEVNLSEKNN